MNDNPYLQGEDGRYPPRLPISPGDYEHQHVAPDGTQHLWNNPDGDYDIVLPDGSFGAGEYGQLTWYHPDGHPIGHPVYTDPGVEGVDTELRGWEYRLQANAFRAMWDSPAAASPPDPPPRRRGRLGRLLGWRR